jgi:hypothetical protein
MVRRCEELVGAHASRLGALRAELDEPNGILLLGDEQMAVPE